MVNFNKIIGLAGLATAFAGMAFGQATCAVAGGTATTNIIRAEGTTEQVASVAFTCTSAAMLPAGTATVQVFISPSLPVTSKVLSTSGATAGQTEALISVNGAAAGAAGSAYGVASGSALSFSGLALPAVAVANCGANFCYNFVISDVRVNATSLALGSGVPPNVTETVFVSGSATSINPAALNAVTVAFAQNGLGTTKLYKGFTTGIVNALNANAANFPNGAVGTSTGANNYPVCANYSPAADKVAFANGNAAGKSLMTVVQINENFASAFRTAAGEASQVADNIGTTTNAVVDGTRVQLNVSNVPTGVTLYVPTGQIGAQVGAGLIQLTASGAGSAFAAVSNSTATGVINTSSFTFNGNWGVAPITTTAGSGFATFEVVTQDLTNIDSYNVPVFIVFTANPAVGTSTPISISVSFGPIGSTAIPNFAVGTSTTTLSGGTFSLCSTNLLFPFVTNQLGFDTGLAISNTSSDPYGSTYGATSQAGTCTINFYGANAPTPASVTTPSVAAGSTYTTVVSGLAPNFQGYIIVQCQFQYGHGFGFVTNAGSAGPAAIAQGYTAAVIPDPVTNGGRAASPNGLAAANTGENLGQ